MSAADLALVRVPMGEELETVAVSGPAALAAELDGTHLDAGDLPPSTITELAAAPAGVRHTAARAGAESVLVIPVHTDTSAGTLELYRAGAAFTATERFAAELAAGQAALVLRVFAGGARPADARSPSPLELAGEALAAALGEGDSASEIVRVAASVAGAAAGLIWEQAPGGLLLNGSFGLAADAELGPARGSRGEALGERGPLHIVESERLPGGCTVSTSLPLGQPVAGILQLLFAPGTAPDAESSGGCDVRRPRGPRVRASERARFLALELDRTRALLAVVGQATAELSLAHTLDTALERVPSCSRSMPWPSTCLQTRTASSRLRRAGLPARTRASPSTCSSWLRGHRARRPDDVSRDRRLRSVRDAARESGIEAALAIPLLVRSEVIGLLAVYPGPRPPSDGQRGGAARCACRAARGRDAERAAPRAGHRPHHQREAALASERDAARRLGALYEISRSFAQELSLDKTLEALAQTVVDVLDVDAAVIGMPDDRRELLTPRAEHIKDAQLRDAAHVILSRAEPFGGAAVQQLFRERLPFPSSAATSCSSRFSREAGRRRRPRRDPRRDDRCAPDLLLPARLSDHGRDGGRGARDRRPGGARDRQRASVPAAEGVCGHDAALAPAARRPGRAGTRGRRRVRVVRPRRCRRRHLRLRSARRRTARRRARGRDRPRRRGDRRHGDGEVRLSLARARASGAGRLPRFSPTTSSSTRSRRASSSR